MSKTKGHIGKRFGSTKRKIKDQTDYRMRARGRQAAHKALKGDLYATWPLPCECSDWWHFD